MVFADQAAESLPALDPGGDIDGAAGLPRRFLLQSTERDGRLPRAEDVLELLWPQADAYG